MRILVLHGPNLNLLGSRNVSIYGSENLAEIDESLAKLAADAGHSVDSVQSNHEGVLIDELHKTQADGVLLNPGALAHTSYVLRDAIEAIKPPVVEVHLSNIFGREHFRRRSVVSPVCIGVVTGFGAGSYAAGLSALLAKLAGAK